MVRRSSSSGTQSTKYPAYVSAIVKTGLIAVSFATLVSCHSARAATNRTASTETTEEWMGIYFGDQKVGFTSTKSEPTTFNGIKAVRETAHEVMKLTLLGTTVQEDTVVETIGDLKDRPLHQDYLVKSNGSNIHVVADFDYAIGVVHCVIGEGSARTKKEIKIPLGANLTGNEGSPTHGKSLRIGEHFTMTYLEPVTVALLDSTVDVTGRETIRDDSGQSVSAYVVKSHQSIGDIVSWADEQGDEIKSEVSFGPIRLSMIRESKQHAEDPKSISVALTRAVEPVITSPGNTSKEASHSKKYVPPSDFAVATAITADKIIHNPRQVRSLRVTIEGIPFDHLILSDARQKETVLSASGAVPIKASVVVAAESIADSNDAGASIGDNDTSEWLKRAAYLPIDDPEIRRTAASIRGAETNPRKVAIAIRNWVNAKMTPDASIGVPRSAKDIIDRRRGVCRDYATLFAALARSSGIPTRLCSGIVYAVSSFMYHAWDESYIDGRWIAIDPTLYDSDKPIDYVDATHIKFAQGDVTSMFDMVGIIGRLKITVQDFAQ